MSEYSESPYAPEFSPCSILNEIRESWTEDLLFDYDESGDVEWALSENLKQRVFKWFQWFVETHPTDTRPRDIARCASQLGEVDFRIVFLANPIDASRLLRLADACYAIDDILFEGVFPAPESYLKSKDLDVIEYLESAQMRQLWTQSLAAWVHEITTSPGPHIESSDRFRELDARQTTLFNIQSTECSFWDSVNRDLPDSLNYYSTEKLYSAVSARIEVLGDVLPLVSTAIATSRAAWRTSCQQLGMNSALMLNSASIAENTGPFNEGLRSRKNASPAIATLNDAAAEARSVAMSTSYEGNSNTVLAATSGTPHDHVLAPAMTSSTSRNELQEITPKIHRGLLFFPLRIRLWRNLELALDWLTTLNIPQFLFERSTTRLIVFGSSCLALVLLCLGIVTHLRTRSPARSSGGDLLTNASSLIQGLLSSYLTALTALRQSGRHVPRNIWFCVMWTATFVFTVAGFISSVVSLPTSVVCGSIAAAASVLNQWRDLEDGDGKQKHRAATF